MSRVSFFQTCLFHSLPNRTSACPAPVRTSTKGLPSQVVMSFQEGAERFGGVFERFPKPVLTLTLMPLVNVSRCFGERTRTSYPEGCLSGGLSACLFFFLSFLCDWINFSSLPDGLRQFLFGDHNPFCVMGCMIWRAAIT